MKKLLIGMALLGISLTTYAACTTHTVMSGGKVVMCTTCCDSLGNCNTTCFQGRVMWVLLDFDGEPIRYYNYPATGTVEVAVKKLSYTEIIEQLGEALL